MKPKNWIEIYMEEYVIRNDIVKMVWIWKGNEKCLSTHQNILKNCISRTALISVCSGHINWWNRINFHNKTSEQSTDIWNLSQHNTWNGWKNRKTSYWIAFVGQLDIQNKKRSCQARV